MRCRAWRRPSGLLLLLVAALLPAGPAATQTPEPASGPLGARFALPNGLVVLVAERPALPVVVVRATVGGGAVLDPPDKAGLANLTAALLTRGTESRAGPEIDRAIDFVGGSLSTEGGRDSGEAALSVLRRDLPLGLDLLADALLRPTFPPDELERTREEVRASIRRSDEDPEAVAGRLFRSLAFPGHPYGQPIVGTEESVGRLSRQDVTAFYAATYRPETTVVAVVGDVTVAEVREALARRFGGWAAPAAPPPPPAAATLGSPPGMEMVQRELVQASVLLGQATVSRPHPDYYPLVLAAHILGGGSASRLYTRVREERGLAYSVYADYAPGRFGGMFVVGFQCRNTRVREVLALVREELRRLRRERVSDEELERGKAYLTGSFPLRMDTNAELASLLLGIERFGLGLDYPARYREAVLAVTAEAIFQAVNRQWSPDAMSLAVVGNLREAGLAGP